jgi:hypothetical protein
MGATVLQFVSALSDSFFMEISTRSRIAQTDIFIKRMKSQIDIRI